MSSALPRSAVEIAKAVKNGAVSAVEVTRAALDRIADRDGVIGAFTDVTSARALREAATLDQKRRQGAELPALAGVPFAAKNLFDIVGLATLSGSKINRALPAAEQDAVLIRRMSAAGGILLGGLNMGEYAYDFTGENAHYGPSRNPLDETRMAGGSSGGSGAAVAAGYVPIALGSDTNGSIRVPSSFCGLYGLKPTYGRLPRTGTFPFCDSLDHLGPFATTVTDLAVAYDVMQGPDANDAACAKKPVQPVSHFVDRGIDGIRIAVAGGYFRKDAEAGALAAVDRAASALGVSALVDIPNADRARAAAFLITNAEGSSLHLDRLRQHVRDFDPDTRDRFLAGALMPASWYISAQRFRRQFAETMREVFASVDVLLAPSTPCSAPKLGQKTMMLGGQEVPLRANIGIFTQPISFVGLPVAAVPVYVDEPMPYGLQVIASPWREDLCIRVAGALEAARLVRQ